MSSSKDKSRSDAANMHKSGWGICGDEGETFSRDGMDKAAVRAMYQQPSEPRGSRDDIDCYYLEDGESGNQLLKNARQGNMPLMGKGSPTSPEQTGIRSNRRKLSGAF
jgi:hypothetical protein